ncbi:MAG TPA: apolipoprotein N-acyltransferase [Candidatus Limnocylindria bacterium]|nr:apolipoprotein N-acyltransferase [Candidatus Limnocylindria bacterium]
MERLRTPWGRLAGGAASGVLLMLAFAPYDLWAAAPVSVAALTLAVRGASLRLAALVGLAAGLGLFVPLLHWTGVYVGPVPWLFLAAYQAVYVVPLAVGSTLVQRLRWWPLWVACLWVTEEALRSRWFFEGFTWGRLAFSQVDGPVLGLAVLGGAPLMTFAVALAGALSAAGVLAAARGPGRVAGAAFAGAAAAVAVGALVPPANPLGATVVAAVIQGNVPRLGLDFNSQREAVLRNHVEGTLKLAAAVADGTQPQPDLVIWPENASDVDPVGDPAAAALIQGAVDTIAAPVLVGAVLDNPADPSTILNVGIVWEPSGASDPGGPSEVYVKRHPVPFGEYIPFRSLARLVSKEVDRVPRDFAAGDRAGVLQMGPARVGDVICFEVAYDGLVRSAVVEGAQLLTVQTNNATFGRTPQTEQQLAMSRLRAVEHGRWVLVAATSGVSATVAPDGTVEQRAEIFTEAQLVQAVRLSDTLTPADRVGAMPEVLLALVGFGAAAWSGTVIWRQRRRNPVGPTLSPDEAAPQ